MKSELLKAKKEKNLNTLGNAKVLPDVIAPADRLKRKLDQEHGVQLQKLIDEKERLDIELYGPSKKPPPSPGQFKLIA